MTKKFYLTKEGLDKIEREYRELKKIRFAKIKGESPKIWHSEDVNPEYLSFQEDLNFLESRIAELEYILKSVELIKIPPKGKQNIVNLELRFKLKSMVKSMSLRLSELWKLILI